MFLHANYYQYIKINKFDAKSLCKQLALLKNNLLKENPNNDAYSKMDQTNELGLTENLVDSDAVIMVISGNKSSMEKILYLSRNSESLLGYAYDELQVASQIMPKPFDS